MNWICRFFGGEQIYTPPGGLMAERRGGRRWRGRSNMVSWSCVAQDRRRRPAPGPRRRSALQGRVANAAIFLDFPGDSLMDRALQGRTTPRQPAAATLGWLPHGYTRTLRPPRLRPPHTHIGGHNRQPTSHELSILVRENGRTGRGTLQRDDANRSTYSCPKFETAMRRAGQFASSRVLSRRP
jgi:hypothetical protein